jgi:uncharacterized protein with GYD domain
MATYISLLRWTQQGIEKVKESPKRLDAAKKIFKAAGADIKETYLVTGQYDLVVIAEAPDDETIARLMLTLGQKGNIRSETVRAFPEKEYRKLIGSIPQS